MSGPDHPNVAFALNNLGSLYLRRKEPARAVTFYSKVLAIRRAQLALYELFIKRARSFIVKMCATLGTLLDARDYGDVTGS